MMKPQPLTTVERGYLVKWIEGGGYGCKSKPPCDCFQHVIERLFAAEAYWRQAVKSAAIPTLAGECVDDECPFCRGEVCTDPPHKSDCPWLLAQESQ